MAQLTLNKYVRSSFRLFSIINGAEATQPMVPTKPEVRLTKSKMGGCRVTICIKLKRFDAWLISIALFRPMRSHNKPAGNATSPVAMAFAVNILPMKSGWKPIAPKFRYK